MEDSEDDFQDPYVKKLQQAVRKVKNDREMGERYMLFQEMLDDERNEGEKKGRIKQSIQFIKETLEEKNIIFSESLYTAIMNKQDPELAYKLSRIAVKSQTKEEFQKCLYDVGIEEA